MSFIRSAPLKAVSRRNISISLNPATHSISQDSIKENIVTERSERSSKNDLTVSEYLTHLRNSQKLYNRSSASSLIQTEQLSDAQIHLAAPIRVALSSKDFESTLQQLSHIVRKENWNLLHEGLTQFEISLIIKSLLNEHAKEFAKSQTYRIAKDNSHTDKSRQIGYILRHLQTGLSSVGYEFSAIDYENFLKLEVRVLNFTNATKIIDLMHSKSLTNSLTFQNLKLRVLGNTRPENWKLINNTKRAISSRSINLQEQSSINKPMTSLLYEFSSHLSEFQPNLQSHKEIIGGFGRVGDLTQIRQHVFEIWGIDTSNIDSIDLIKKVSVGSSVYPDNKLMEILVTSFAFNGEMNEALKLLNNFDKNYNLRLNKDTHFWRVLLTNLEINYSEDLENYKKFFNHIWKLIQQKKVPFASSLYMKRLRFLNKIGDYQQILQDLTLIQTNYFNQLNSYELIKTQSLMTRYLNILMYDLLKSNNDEKIDYLLDNFTFNELHRSKVLKDLVEIKEKVKIENDKFEELQKQYDEEDDENSIW
ncbi:hypothetical protein WICMUC_004069 [Wickerhamomyces mucosus]|uniref:ATPase expression protein 2, mitochondrial n=1 Tax=Wickerhamomyces mucosus TaxID=1378264 RepID=A0A9P8PJ98_9ASCO|nr:hypothetical protein WICMUC_004069 [Wickerhamomyces mucosus]